METVMFEYNPNRDGGRTLATILLATTLATLGSGNVDAQSLTIDTDLSNVRWGGSTAPRDADFDLDQLRNIRVRAHRFGVSPHWNDWIYLQPGAVPMNGAEDRTWVETWAGGYHETAGYSVHVYLTEEGEIAFNFQGFESAQIEGFEIALGAYFCFDRTEPDPGTPGSGTGSDIALDDTLRSGYARSGDLDLLVTYQIPIQLPGEPVHGDIFENLYITVVDDLFQSTDSFGLVTDIDFRYDDPGPRYNHESAFSWGGGIWTPMHGSLPTVLPSAVLELCRNGDGQNVLPDAVSLDLPEGSCYFRVEVDDDWGCDSTQAEADWDILSAGASGVPTGFMLGSTGTKGDCIRMINMGGPASLDRLGPDADWYLSVESSGGATDELDLPEDWFLTGGLEFSLETHVKSAGVGFAEDDDSLIVMSFESEEASILEIYSHSLPYVEDFTALELRVRGVTYEDALASQLTPHEVVLKTNWNCIGFAGMEITECSDTSMPPQDLNGDGAVDGMDIAEVLASWGACDGCPADFNGDGEVNGGDFALILTAWTG